MRGTAEFSSISLAICFRCLFSLSKISANQCGGEKKSDFQPDEMMVSSAYNTRIVVPFTSSTFLADFFKVFALFSSMMAKKIENEIFFIFSNNAQMSLGKKSAQRIESQEKKSSTMDVIQPTYIYT